MPPLGADALARIAAFLDRGGPAMWAISALSVLTLALILWKVVGIARLGGWSRGRTPEAIALWSDGRRAEALSLLAGRPGARARLALAAMAAADDPGLDPETRREEVTRVAKILLAEARSGLRGLELIATIAPLIGLLGTVLGMIAAFQALQAAGARADPAALAGGIWEALLTTAAGMTVAIPASMALTWFESVVDRLRRDMENAATLILRPVEAAPLAVAAQ